MIGHRRERPRRGNLAATLVVALGALALGASCTTKGDGLILVRLTSSQPLANVQVFVTAPGGQPVLAMATAAWPTTPPLQLGIYVKSTVSGQVNVIACGFDGSDNLVAATPDDPASYSTGARPGAGSEIVAIALAPGSAPPVCMVGGVGGRGGSGGGGGSAGGSTGGSTSTGGTGGGAGTGGVAGTTGAGGTSGTGGGAGGVAGTGGRGGTTGAGGVAGTGGSGGRGGAAGTGGTGGSVGGTGGAAGMWRGAVPVGGLVGNQTSGYPAVAVDANGNAVVVYEQGLQLWANRYNAGTNSWGTTPAVIDARGRIWSKPSIAVDKNGNYLVVWGLEVGTSLRGIWYSTSSNGTQWAAPMALATTNSYGPVLAMNADGAAVVAWNEQVTGGDIQAVAMVRTGPGIPWAGPQVMRAANDTGDRSPAVAMTGSGFALVGWEQGDIGSPYWLSAWMRVFAPGVGWGNADEPFETYNNQSAYDVSIAANSGSEAIATYIQITNGNPPQVQLWARRFNQSFVASASKVFEAASIDTFVPPSVTLDDNGNATVAFAVETSTGYQVQASRTARAEANWPTTPTPMETDNTAKDNVPADSIAYVTVPIVRCDPAGNVTLVWRKRTATSGTRFDLVSRRYAAGSWAPQVSLEENTTNSVFWPTLAVGTNGTAVTTWYFGTTVDVVANVWR